MGKGIRIFFVTDVHGSNVCYRKFLNALKVYNVDVGILLGDLTGKMLIPLVEKAGGRVGYHLYGPPARDRNARRAG